MAGIFIIEGMQLHISEFSISADEEGNVSSNGPTIKVAYDTCIAWAKIALRHKKEAKLLAEQRREIWEKQASPNERAYALEEEFHASMQAAVAAATCIDALYDHIIPLAPIDAKIRTAWKRKKTARYAQVTEAFRAAFNIKPEELKPMSETIKATYLLRDASVHPSNAVRLPYKHPELDILTDWRLTTFRGDVADILVCSAVGLLWDITRGEKYRSKELTKFIDGFRKKVDALLPEGKPIADNKTITFDIPPRIKATEKTKSI